MQQVVDVGCKNSGNITRKTLTLTTLSLHTHTYVVTKLCIHAESHVLFVSYGPKYQRIVGIIAKAADE